MVGVYQFLNNVTIIISLFQLMIFYVNLANYPLLIKRMVNNKKLDYLIILIKWICYNII